MSKSSDDNLEKWEQLLKGVLLDPFTNYLDENQFRIDLFDTTDEYIVEIFTSEMEIEEIEISKSDANLNISLKCEKEQEARKRSIPFPFSLKQHHINAKYQGDWLEVYIKKERCMNQPQSTCIRMQGIFDDEA
ncbi:hypothetical protein [Bacillus sp. 2205SS5-2]|uniref:hypothetical protein n=1 Tax=Bacillus sp. 2205SS5-2 TaxID=3109031 RepID=UPI003006EA03